MIQATRIAEVLGAEKVLKRNVRSLADLTRVIRDGLPKSALKVVAGHLAADARGVNRIVYRVVPAATYKHGTTRMRRAAF